LRRAAILALGALAGLCACQPQAPPKSPAEILAHAGAMTPSDPRLGDLYAHACKACHIVSGSGAPLVGDRAAWAPRAAKGMSALMKNVVTGYKGMPAGGQCFSCTSQDDQELIRFMADQPVN
jgi:cytochrome c5